MITNFETNKIFIAKGISSVPYLKVCYSLVSAFHRLDSEWSFLPYTSSSLHIWARDYMPIQVSKNKFICFCYAPDYLGNNPEYKPQTDKIISQLGIKTIFSPIILDGGNVISCGNKVILTDKIFQENPQYSSVKLIDELMELFEAELVLIPWDKYEEYGHSDGMVRYVGESRVLLNNYFDFDRSLRKKLLDILVPHFDVEELHYGGYTSNSWAYLNFLHVGSNIFVPMLNEKHDCSAFSQIESIFSQCKCHAISNCKKLVRDGGALNCSSWNILVDVPKREDRLELPNE